MTATPPPQAPSTPRPGPGAPSACHDQALAAPPPDVHALLDFERSSLAVYFDARRADACQRSQRDWPQLWRLASAPE